MLATYKNKSQEELKALMELILKNMQGLSDESDDTDGTTRHINHQVDSLYQQIIDALPDEIAGECNHPAGRNYMIVKTKREDTKRYILQLSLRRGTTHVQIETYGGPKDRDSLDDYIKRNNIHDKLNSKGIELKGPKQGVRQPNRYYWEAVGTYEGEEETVVNWFIKVLAEMFRAFEPLQTETIR